MDEIGLHERIAERYKAESARNCSLSCGSTLDEIGISRGEVILDLGCGRGDDTIRAARKAGPEGKAVGVDLTEAMIDRAGDLAAAEGIDNAVFVQGDIESLPFQENTFDGVMSNCVINHAKDKIRVYREIRRVLKPGGRFVVADAVTKDPLPDEVKNDPEAWASVTGARSPKKNILKAYRRPGF